VRHGRQYVSFVIVAAIAFASLLQFACAAIHVCIKQDGCCNYVMRRQHSAIHEHFKTASTESEDVDMHVIGHI
jgi:hypothetical protein